MKVDHCYEPPLVYQFDTDQDALVPVDDFRFPIEVYEQGRIHRLRDDVGRQLDMLDEFADLADLKNNRASIISKLTTSAQALAPFYEEREGLLLEVALLPQLKQELAEKEKFLPGKEEKLLYPNAQGYDTG